MRVCGASGPLFVPASWTIAGGCELSNTAVLLKDHHIYCAPGDANLVPIMRELP
jgi:hypothetical protein